MLCAELSNQTNRFAGADEIVCGKLRVDLTIVSAQEKCHRNADCWNGLWKIYLQDVSYFAQTPNG